MHISTMPQIRWAIVFLMAAAMLLCTDLGTYNDYTVECLKGMDVLYWRQITM